VSGCHYSLAEYKLVRKISLLMATSPHFGSQQLHHQPSGLIARACCLQVFLGDQWVETAS